MAAWTHNEVVITFIDEIKGTPAAAISNGYFYDIIEMSTPSWLEAVNQAYIDRNPVSGFRHVSNTN